MNISSATIQSHGIRFWSDNFISEAMVKNHYVALRGLSSKIASKKSNHCLKMLELIMLLHKMNSEIQSKTSLLLKKSNYFSNLSYLLAKGVYVCRL